MNQFSKNGINYLKKRILDSQFFRDIAILTTGSFISQLILILFSPLLTRLYEPVDFAKFYLINTLSTTLLPAISLRYNLALVVVKDKKESDKLFKLSVWVTFFISFFALLLLLFNRNYFIDILNAQNIEEWFMAIPIITFFSGLNLIFISYSNRYKRYKLIRNILILKSLFSTFVSISLPFLWDGIGSSGLIISFLLTPVFTLFLFLFNYKESLKKINFKFNFGLFDLAKKYRKFPLLSAAPTFLNNFMSSLPILFLTKYYPVAIVGYYSLSSRIAIAPLGFISKSIAQVHIRKVAELTHSNKNPIEYIFKLTLLLISIISIPFLLFTFFGKFLIPLIFGKEWEMAGIIISVLMPAISIKFIVSTLSGVFSSTGNNKISAAWQILAFLTTFFVLYCFSGKLSIVNLLIVMTFTDIALYIVYYFLILYAVKNPREIAS